MLKADTSLQRVPELFMELESANLVRIHHDRRVWEFGQHTLALLDAFYAPTSIAECLQRLGPRLKSRRAMEEALTTLSMLVSAGILTEESPTGFTDLMFPTGGYGLAHLNIRILEDPVRKATFIRAINEVVTPDDVVLDLGTGSGILAVAAAKAGARHVYAVEPARSGDLAAEIAKANGVADRISFVKGWSSTTELPEPATVLTTDIVGNDALDMVIWESVQDARKRLLAPDARLIPSSFETYLYLVDMPEKAVGQQRILPQQIKRWQSRYGIDFSPMLDADRGRVAGFYERPETVQQWRRMSLPQTLSRIDLRQDARVFEGEVTLTASRHGTVSGAVLYFEAQMSPGVSMSTAPWDGDELSHWFTACWALESEIEVVPGDDIRLRYRYEGDGRASLALAGD
ncbi:50S ribosomal protein L11 methyltransferase [Streptosporangium sp. CA-135522]|uniref:50S ribosomal protein L11 methyltransferase n=1 Tax=Streptosporangium sp. CA-135522 TaxID=3240072 RepID=UPI003D9098D7